MATTYPKITLGAARANAGLTLVEAAKLIGVSVQTLVNWEKDSSNVKVSQVKKIEEVYNFPSEYIFLEVN